LEKATVNLGSNSHSTEVIENFSFSKLEDGLAAAAAVAVWLCFGANMAAAAGAFAAVAAAPWFPALLGEVSGRIGLLATSALFSVDCWGFCEGLRVESFDSSSLGIDEETSDLKSGLMK